LLSLLLLAQSSPLLRIPVESPTAASITRSTAAGAAPDTGGVAAHGFGVDASRGGFGVTSWFLMHGRCGAQVGQDFWNAAAAGSPPATYADFMTGWTQNCGAWSDTVCNDNLLCAGQATGAVYNTDTASCTLD
jgi:hypothetical protein